MSGEKLCCCPLGSWPAFIPEADYDKQVKGSVVKVPIPNAPNKDDPTMRVYRTGNKDSKVVIVYVMDVFGLDHSRSKGIADTLSELTGGCEVLVPDILCEDWCQDLSTVMEWIKPFGWPEGIKPRMEAFLNHQEFNLTVAGDNKRKVVLVGFCYGTYIAANLCSKAFQKGFADANDGKTIDIICDVGYHPSNRLAPAFGQDEWALAEDSNEAIPHFLLATNDDPPGYHPKQDGVEGSGRLADIFSSKNGKSECHPAFEGMNHGYVPRGDCSIPEVKTAVEKSISMGVAFMKKCGAC